MKFLKILYSLLLVIWTISKMIIKKDFEYIFELFCGLFKYLKSIFVTFLEEKNYETIKEIQKNKRVSYKILFKNKFFFKENYPFYITNFILFGFYIFILFDNIPDKKISFFLTFVIISIMVVVCALEFKNSLKKGIIEKVFVEEKVDTILDKIIKIIKNWLKK